MNPLFQIGLGHFLVVSFLLVAAGIATMLTKRNAIGILIGVELVLNAAAINFVAFNRYGWPSETRETASLQQSGAARSARLTIIGDDATPRSAAEGGGEAVATVIDGSRVSLSVAPEIAHPLRAEGDDTPTTQPGTLPAGTGVVEARFLSVRPAIHGRMFAIFIIVLAAAEAAVALAIFLNFYNNFSSIDVERGDELKG